jgi:hypothetical protein
VHYALSFDPFHLSSPFGRQNFVGARAAAAATPFTCFPCGVDSCALDAGGDAVCPAEQRSEASNQRGTLRGTALVPSCFFPHISYLYLLPVLTGHTLPAYSCVRYPHTHVSVTRILGSYVTRILLCDGHLAISILCLPAIWPLPPAAWTATLCKSTHQLGTWC